MPDFQLALGAVLLEPHEHWQPEGRRRFCAESMTSIPKLDDIPVLPAARAWGQCHTHRRHSVLNLKHIRGWTKDLTSQLSRLIVHR